MNEGPLFPDGPIKEKYQGYVTTIAGVDIHFNGEYICLCWGYSDSTWDGCLSSKWATAPSAALRDLRYQPPERTHSELVSFIQPFCQLHQ